MILYHYLQLTTSNTVKASLISSSATKESIFPATMNRKSGNLGEIFNISVSHNIVLYCCQSASILKVYDKKV